MEKKSRKGIIKKIALTLCIVIVCCFIVPKPVNAASWIINAGGTLIDLVMQLFIFLGDCILNLLQSNFISTQNVVIQANAASTGGWDAVGILKVVIGALLIVASICITIATLGAGTGVGIAGVVAGIKVVGGIILAAGTGTILAVSGVNDNVSRLKGNFDLPMIRYTPYEIFSGQIPIFDINFINPMSTIIESEGELVDVRIKHILQDIQDSRADDKALNAYNIKDYSKTFIEQGKNWINTIEDLRNSLEKYEIKGDEYKYNDEKYYEYEGELNAVEPLPYYSPSATSFAVDEDITCLIDWINNDDGAMSELNYMLEIAEDEDNNDTFQASVLEQGPGMFYSRLSTVWSIIEDYYNNYLTESSQQPNDEVMEEYETVKEYRETKHKEYKSTSAILQNSIATWYKVLRTVALVGLLSVLIYIGIRILFTAAVEDKAKYKKMLIDWVVAICILFVLHYLMVFMLTISTSLTKIFIAKGEENIMIPLPADTKVNGESLTVNEDATGEFAGKPVWSTSFTGYARLLAGAYNDNCGSENLAYGIIYIVMVIYTLMFTFMYLKRAIYMAFLTMIAPLIALTYPLDKIKDGKAQAFGLWIREYIFNCLMQPIHLIIYIMVISTVMEYVKDHPVYALVALGFLIPAEQFMRKLFGFEKAGTVSTLGKMAGGAALMTGIKSLSKLDKRRPPDHDRDNKSKPIRTQEQSGYSLPDIPTSMNNTVVSSQNRQINRQTVSQNSNYISNQTLNNSEIRTNNTSTSEMNNINMQNMQNNANYHETYQANNTQNHSQYTSRNELNSNLQQNNSNLNFASNLNYTKNGFNNNINNNVTRNQNMNKKSMSTWAKFVAGTNSVGEHYRQKVIKSKPLRSIGKFTARGIGGIALGTVGLAAGIASGDASKALSYTAAAVGIGATLGKTTMENVMDEAHDVKETFAKGFNGDQVYMNKKLDKIFFSSREFQTIINDHSIHPELLNGIADQQERIKVIQKEIMQYRKSGISDTKKIKKSMKLKLSPKQGALAIQLSERIGKSGWNNEATRVRYYNDYFAILSDELGDEEAKKIWEAIPKLLF